MDLIGQKVQVYRNLRRGDWSVRANGKVIAHLDTIILADVTFTVRESARQRVLRDRERSVHAWANGIVADVSLAYPGLIERFPAAPITYNPYRCGSFTANGAPVQGADFVEFSPCGKAAAYRLR